MKFSDVIKFGVLAFTVMVTGFLARRGQKHSPPDPPPPPATGEDTRARPRRPRQ